MIKTSVITFDMTLSVRHVVVTDFCGANTGFPRPIVTFPVYKKVRIANYNTDACLLMS